jgi:hypothetical protein
MAAGCCYKLLLKSELVAAGCSGAEDIICCGCGSGKSAHSGSSVRRVQLIGDSSSRSTVKLKGLIQRGLLLSCSSSGSGNSGGRRGVIGLIG